MHLQTRSLSIGEIFAPVGDKNYYRIKEQIISNHVSTVPKTTVIQPQPHDILRTSNPPVMKAIATSNVTWDNAFVTHLKQNWVYYLVGGLFLAVVYLYAKKEEEREY
jgi:uncharacterized membrane protein